MGSQLLPEEILGNPLEDYPRPLRCIVMCWCVCCSLDQKILPWAQGAKLTVVLGLLLKRPANPTARPCRNRSRLCWPHGPPRLALPHFAPWGVGMQPYMTTFVLRFDWSMPRFDWGFDNVLQTFSTTFWLGFRCCCQPHTYVICDITGNMAQRFFKVFLPVWSYSSTWTANVFLRFCWHTGRWLTFF